jgi:hypothetical protein
MRNVRRLVLLAIMALAAAAIAAPAALAQSNPENHETLEAFNEKTQVHCPAVMKVNHVVSGGCLIHATSNGEVELRKHVFGIESHIATCENEFYGRLNEDAEGYILHQKLFHAGCVRQPCVEAGEPEPTPWPAHGDELHQPGVDGETGVTSPIAGHREVLTTNFCVEPVGGGADETCEIDVAFNDHADVGKPHEYEFGGSGVEMASHGISGFRCEVVGHWTTEHIENGTAAGKEENLANGQQEIEVDVNHLPNENKAENP